MRKLLYKLCAWGKKHIFHFVTSILLIILGSAIVVQSILMYSLYKEMNEKMISLKSDTRNVINDLESRTFEKMNKNYEITSARMDTLNSAIEPDNKRKMLVTKIRDAINVNTNISIGVRDLNRIANAVIDYSYEFNLTIPQVLAQIRVESNFDTHAVSGAGAQGLMQIMPQTLQYINYEMSARLNPWNIAHNIRAGCFYMSEQMTEFGTYAEALRAYNWGPDNLRRWNAGEIEKEPKETLEYVGKVSKFIEVFKSYGLE